MADDDDRHRDGAGGAGAGSPGAGNHDVNWVNATAPDDISELSRDVIAYRRELRAARRQQRLGRFAPGPTAAPITMTVIALAVIAAIAAMLTVLGPKRDASPSPAPLANTTVKAGLVGGRLPNVLLSSASNTTVSAQGLRPAVIAVVPPACACVRLVQDAATLAGSRNIDLYAVLQSEPSAERDSYNGVLDSNAVLTDDADNDFQGAIDPAGAAIDPTGLTLLLVRSNGTIFRVERDASNSTVEALAGNLLTMLRNAG